MQKGRNQVKAWGNEAEARQAGEEALLQALSHFPPPASGQTPSLAATSNASRGISTCEVCLGNFYSFNIVSHQAQCSGAKEKPTPALPAHPPQRANKVLFVGDVCKLREGNSSFGHPSHVFHMRYMIYLRYPLPSRCF